MGNRDVTDPFADDHDLAPTVQSELWSDDRLPKIGLVAALARIVLPRDDSESV